MDGKQNNFVIYQIQVIIKCRIKTMSLIFLFQIPIFINTFLINLNGYNIRAALQHCQFPPYSKVNQLYLYIYTVFIGLPSH